VRTRTRSVSFTYETERRGVSRAAAVAAAVVAAAAIHEMIDE